MVWLHAETHAPGLLERERLHDDMPGHGNELFHVIHPTEASAAESDSKIASASTGGTAR